EERCEASCLDAQLPAISVAPEDNPVSAVGADDLAYVIYTSGSSGIPKGVGVPNRGVVRLVRQEAYARFSAEEVFLQMAPISFDASTFEIWGGLLHRSRLALMPVVRAASGDVAR